ncbi:hypothetical protein B2J88_52185, partial [Rhodococcus sp. SRB_17]|nr:hypothetical protein [Rhodococcus sp. SRB_17]
MADRRALRQAVRGIMVGCARLQEGKHMAWNVVGSEVCELGESPFWQAGEQRLYWVDIAGRAALRADPATGATERWPLP